VKKDYSWMKPSNKLEDDVQDVNDDIEEKDVSNVSKSRRYLPYPTVNLTFPATSPTSRFETVANGSPLSSKKPIYQKHKDNETAIANMEYIPISTNDGYVSQQIESRTPNRSSNNVNTGNNSSVRPKSAPSNSKRSSNTDSLVMKPSDPPTSIQQLEVQGVNLFTTSGSFRVTAASDLIVSEVSPDHAVERQTIRDLKHTDSNNAKLANTATSNSKRPSSAGSTNQRLRRPRPQQATENSPQLSDPNVVKETPQRTLLRKYYGQNENVEDIKPSGTAETTKRRKTPKREKRKGTVNHLQGRNVEGDIESKANERERKYKQKETILSQREANFKENYLVRQLKRLGVGSSDT